MLSEPNCYTLRFFYFFFFVPHTEVALAAFEQYVIVSKFDFLWFILLIAG